MRIVTTLKTLLQQQVSDGIIKLYSYTWANEADKLLGTATLWPYAILLTPQQWGMEVDTATAREYGLFKVHYLTPQALLEFDASQNEVLIDQMADCAVDLIGRIRRDRRLHIEETEVEAQSLYDVNSRNLTGVLLNLNLKENQGRCLGGGGVVCS